MRPKRLMTPAYCKEVFHYNGGSDAVSLTPLKIIIAAMDKHRLIGQGDQLPWHVPEEYQQFLSFITGQTVIMGRQTFEIFSNDLPSTRTFVITRQQKSYRHATTCHSFEEALDLASAYPETIFFAGGVAVYERALRVADKMYLSYMKGEFTGDVYFPPFDRSEWIVEFRTDHPEFEFVVYTRRP